MNCDQCQSQLQAYHDGEIEPAVAHEIEAHLADCAACAAELRVLRAMSQVIQSKLPIIEMSADAVKRLHSQVDHVMDYSLLPLARSFIGIAASILIVASAGLWLMRPKHASEPQPWEGAMLASQQNNDLASQALNTSMPTIEPELIVADLSRSSHR
jgi:anti-sigma factor RsiW